MDSDREIEIARRAYEIWEREGRPDGTALDDWRRAEAELMGTKEVPEALTTGTPPGKPARQKAPVKRK